jgi:hypothetical protein
MYLKEINLSTNYAHFTPLREVSDFLPGQSFFYYLLQGRRVVEIDTCCLALWTPAELICAYVTTFCMNVMPVFPTAHHFNGAAMTNRLTNLRPSTPVVNPRIRKEPSGLLWSSRR